MSERVAGFTVTEGTETRAEHLIRRAFTVNRNGHDAIPALTAAIMQLRIEAGEAPASELEGYWCDCYEDGCPFNEGEA